MNSDASDTEPDVARFEFDTGQADPNVAIARTVASLEGVDTSELPPLYDCIDHIAEHLFSNPPSPEAEAQVRFTYEGYRVTLEQNGAATFRKVE